MLLYTYVLRPHTVETDGIKTPKTAEESRLYHYAGRAQSDKKVCILKYLETVFSGRSRAVSCLTEPVPATDNPKIKGWVERCDCFAFDASELNRNGLIDAVYCANGGVFSHLENGLSEIDFRSPDWESVNPYDNVFFKRIRHYMIVLKNGTVPPDYIKKIL